MKNILLFSTSLALLLTGCQNDTDSRLARGCEAAVKVMLAKDKYDRQIGVIKGKKFGVSEGFKLVTIHTVTKTKEFNDEKDESFECKFEESSMPFGYAWRAALVQVKIDDVVYGSEGGEIYGSIEDQLALTAAVDEAMK
jgi:hypothetical protein